jgi:hypothetical protein
VRPAPPKPPPGRITLAVSLFCGQCTRCGFFFPSAKAPIAAFDETSGSLRLGHIHGAAAFDRTVLCSVVKVASTDSTVLLRAQFDSRNAMGFQSQHFPDKRFHTRLSFLPSRRFHANNQAYPIRGCFSFHTASTEVNIYSLVNPSTLLGEGLSFKAKRVSRGISWFAANVR